MNMRANTVTGLAGVRTNPNQCRMTTFVLASLILVQIALGAESTKVWEENARAVANGVGEFVRATPPGKSGPVYVFEEVHTSRRGQLQIAVMLHRLREKYGLRVIGLEGAIQKAKPLDPSGFLSRGAVADKIARDDVFVGMLRDGEISAAEFAACVEPGVSVWGLEEEAQYNVQLDSVGSPESMYLLMIAEKKVPQSTLEEAGRLLEAKKTQEALGVLKNGDAWIKGQFEKLQDISLSTKARVEQLRGILAEARRLQVTVPSKIEAEMQQTIRFFDTARQRSETMAKAMTRLAAQQRGGSSAMIIGAAHSDEVLEVLTQQNVTAVLLRPRSLRGEGGKDVMDAFDRKNKGLWAADDLGTLGHILNGHRKPPPVIESRNRNAYASARYATMQIARAARGGKRLPDDVISDLNKLPGIEIDPKSFEKRGDDVIFRMGVDDVNGQRQWVWVRTGTRSKVASAASDEGLEKKLLAADASLGGGGGGPKDPKETASKAGEPEGDPGKKDSTDKKNSNEKTDRDASSKESIKSGERLLILERLSDKEFAVFTKDRETVRNAEMITR